jgi:predicted transposase YdaD
MTTAEKLRQEGRQEGRREGRREGRQEGRREGRREGRQEGRREGSYKTLFSMIKIMKNNGISEEKIARYTNLDINTVKKILNGEPVEISLNWIDER